MITRRRLLASAGAAFAFGAVSARAKPYSGFWTLTGDPPDLGKCGGIGDGRTPTSLAAAINWVRSAQAAGAGHIPVGSFILPPLVFSEPVNIEGVGAAGSQITLYSPGTPAQNAVAFIGAAGAGNPGTNTVALRKLTITAPYTQQASAILLLRVPRFTVEDVIVQQGGIWISASYAGVLNRVEVAGYNGAALAYDIDNSGNNATVTGCSFYGNSSWAILMPGDAGNVHPNTTVRIEGNDIEGNGGAMAIVAASGSVRGNHGEKNNGLYKFAGGITVNPGDNYFG